MRLDATPATPPVTTISSLTSLRFFAALAVVVLHYRDLLGPMPDWLMRAIVGGQYGVTFFFVLSGFILVYNYQSWFAQGVSDARYWRFQRFRLARLYPIYLLGLLLDTPWHLIERLQVGQLAESGHLYWASWLINLVGLQAWVPAVPYAMFWNTPAWSVAAEFFFYATFPFVCARLARHAARPARLVATFLVVVALGAMAYALVIYAMLNWFRAGSETQYIVMVYNPLLRYSEFLAGCLAGQFFMSARHVRLMQSRRARNILVIASLAVVALRIASSDYTGPSFALWLADVSVKYAIFIPPFALIILALASGPTFLSRLLEHRTLVLLGEASYALYIIHWPVTSFLRMGFLGTLGTPWVHGLFLLGTVALSVFCYRWIEVPWRRRLRGAPA